MALAHITAFFFLFVTLSEAASLLQRAATRQRAFAGLRYSPQDPAARTLLTLDTNHDGRIDPDEVGAFAHSQGLDAAAATEEFSSIDGNSDGVLDSAELQKVLGGETTELASKEITVEKPKAAQTAPVSLRSAPAEAAKTKVEVEAPLTATAPQEASAPVPPKVEEEAKSSTATAPLVQQASESKASIAQKKETTKTAEAHSASIESPIAARADVVNTALISDEERNSVRKAAQKVAEELALEESEERAARNLDRKAAEVRANSTALAKLTVQDALDAGAKAAHKKADELMAKITKLEEEAERAEVRAAALRAKSKMELDEGNQLMAAAEEALRQPSPP